MSRSAGVKKDLRLVKNQTYANYYNLNFRCFIGQNGDSYDRFLIRMNEMLESINIINQSVDSLFEKKKNHNNFFLDTTLSKKKKNSYNSMESTILHFKHWAEGLNLKKNCVYSAIESPKGEFGVTLFSDGSNKPFKCKIKSPAYINLQSLEYLAKGHYLADLVTLIGTIDIVFGEVDR